MALDLDSFPYEKPAKAGFEFEHLVRHYLRNSVPNDHVFRGGVLLWDGGYGKEVDFVIAGPKGLIIVEAKLIRDAIVGRFEDENWRCSAPDSEDWIIKRPVESINRKRGELRKHLEARINALGPRRGVYLRYTEPLAVFIFSDNARIDPRITACNSSRYHRATRLQDLANTIDQWRPSKNMAVVPVGIEHAKKVLGWLRKTNVDPAPQMIGPYKILSVDKSSRRITDNGLIYTIGLVADAELGKTFRGKRYELPEDKNIDLEHLLPQLKRHALVISKLNHPNIHRYYTFLRSASGREFWVIEEQIEGKSLEAMLCGDLHFELAAARRIMLDVARAIQALHSTGTIHRELTPGAILIEELTNRAIVTNFELAKLPGSPYTVSCDQLPQSPYRPLEVQTDPHSADQRDDIYAWAAIFYRLLTSENYSGTFPSLNRFPAKVRDDLAIVEWCLAPPRIERPSEFADILSALQMRAMATAG